MLILRHTVFDLYAKLGGILVYQPNSQQVGHVLGCHMNIFQKCR